MVQLLEEDNAVCHRAAWSHGRVGKMVGLVGSVDSVGVVGVQDVGGPLVVPVLQLREGSKAFYYPVNPGLTLGWTR